MSGATNSTIHPRAEAVLRFWLGDHALNLAAVDARADPGLGPDRMKLWFGGGPAVDVQIKEQFSTDLDAVVEGAYDAWGDPAAGSPLNTLAGIILCDQFTRNVYRGTPCAFSLDAKALSWAQRLLGVEEVQAWPFSAKNWLFLPFEHSESLENQKRCVELCNAEVERARREGAAPEVVAAAEAFAKYARAHMAIIEKWGRFPHRNAVLGRESTPEEVQGLADGSIGKF